MREINLSNQARWYFNGHFPIYAEPTDGYKKPELLAIEELVNNGLIEEKQDVFGKKIWCMTELGIRINGRLL